jgi:hypothetical protein
MRAVEVLVAGLLLAGAAMGSAAQAKPHVADKVKTTANHVVCANSLECIGAGEGPGR